MSCAGPPARGQTGPPARRRRGLRGIPASAVAGGDRGGPGIDRKQQRHRPARRRMVSRGQIWTVLRGSSQYRALVVSNDEYNERGDVPVRARGVVRDLPRQGQLTVRLRGGDPLSGAYVRIPAVMQMN